MEGVSAGVRTVALCLLLVILCLYGISIGLASYALNEILNHGQVTYIGSGTTVATVVPTFGNVATLMFAFATLVAGMVGLAAVFLGLQHIVVWRSRSMASAANSATMIAWLLSLLAMGLAWKQIDLQGPRNHRLRTLEAFAIFTPWIMLVQLTLLQASLMLGKEQRTPQYPPVSTPRMRV